MISKLDVWVPAEGGIGLGAWHPAITMAHGFAGTREHGLERFTRAFATAGFVFTIIAISGRAVAISAETSIHGCKSEIGAARSAILRPGRKLIRRELAYEARAMPADMLSCSAPPIDACAVSFHRFPQSAVTSRDCGGFHLTPCPPWSMLSTRMRERSRTESRRTDRVPSARTSRPFRAR
jgi:hypothetical protein